MRLAALAVLAALAAPAAAHAAGAADLKVTRQAQLTPRLREYGFDTPALSDETNLRVLLPTGYAAHPGKRYPVLYLLHGCCDFDVRGSQAWTTHGDAEKSTEGLPLIVVMPDGGRGGFYTDWYNNGLGGPPEWDTYHMEELVPWVDQNFRTIAARQGRVIAGLSMGGYGAMKYASEHPDRFVAAATFSGAVDTNQITTELDAFSAMDGGLPGSVFGERATEEIRWHTSNPTDVAENLRGLNLTLRTGNGQAGPYDDPSSGPDALESSVHDQTVALHKQLETLHIPSTFQDYGPGHHAWPYWARDLRLTLPTFMSVLAHPPAPPARVTYKTASPDYTVYGWHVAIKRPALEFSTLSRAGRRGFTLAGSGDAKVTTPARYTAAEVTVGSVAPATQRATAGRLTIPVSLGPANTGQQYGPGVTTTVKTVHVAIRPCLTRRSVVVRVPRGARVNGRRVHRRRVRLRLMPGSVTRVTVVAPGYLRRRSFYACRS